MFPCDWMTSVVKVIDIVYWAPRSRKYASCSSKFMFLTHYSELGATPPTPVHHKHNVLTQCQFLHHRASHGPAGTLSAFFPVSEVRTKKIPVRPCAACQNHCSSKVICSKVHYHHHLWWWIPYDGGRPAAASTHNDILLLLAVTPRQMAHSQQPACQTEHTHNAEFGPHRQKRGGQEQKGRLHLWEGPSI